MDNCGDRTWVGRIIPHAAASVIQGPGVPTRFTFRLKPEATAEFTIRDSPFTIKEFPT
jgi:hypothetical protein